MQSDPSGPRQEVLTPSGSFGALFGAYPEITIATMKNAHIMMRNATKLLVETIVSVSGRTFFCLCRSASAFLPFVSLLTREPIQYSRCCESKCN